jgi:hypothetical protein
MTIKEQLTDALPRPMTRKAFLGQVGALLLAVVDVSAVPKSLGFREIHESAQGSAPALESNSDHEASGYGG